ncbi:MAG: hypothetical protein NTY53_05695, partial [Kiritimatiellaeota bacterium]|nr:hypothetical protein [Kiritimatiellota bacterium]
MSLKLAMQRAARRAPRQLGESAELVRVFLRSRQNPDGGFQDRAGRSDLYYTVFGLDALDAFAETPNLATLENFLRSFGAGESLDFVHLTCLARCWNALPGKIPDATRKALLKKLRTYRAADGGFAPTPAAVHSTTYACLLGGEAFQSLGGGAADLTQRREGKTPLDSARGREGAESASSFASFSWPLRLGVKLFPSFGNFRRQLFQVLEKLRTADGAYANEPGMAFGSTTATAAAVTLLRAVKGSVPPEVAPWLFARCQPCGGFCATPQTPLPDLLSTAVALHALATLGVPLGDIKEPCLNFIDSLWDNTGGFHGHWADDALDVEYTFYALLA